MKIEQIQKVSEKEIPNSFMLRSSLFTFPYNLLHQGLSWWQYILTAIYPDLFV